MKLFIDTNILIDVLEGREPFLKSSANILNLGCTGKVQLYASTLTFINCIYIVRKALGYKKVMESVRLMRKLINVSPMTEKEFDQALFKTTPDVEDLLQYYSAESAKCDVIITRNTKHFPKDGIPVMTAEAFLLSRQTDF